VSARAFVANLRAIANAERASVAAAFAFYQLEEFYA
jgi:hypothetical protein